MADHGVGGTVHRAARAFARLIVLVALASLARPGHAEPPKIVRGALTYGELMLTFDRPMLTWSQVVQDAGIKIDPPVLCRWSWSGDANLLCYVDEIGPPIAPASSYAVRIEGKLWSQDGEEVAPTTLRVDSERPRVDLWNLDWTASAPVVDLQSNLPVDAAALRAVLHAALEDGTPVDFALAPLPDEKPAHPARWRIAFADPGKEGVLALSISPGLTTSAGPLPGVQRETLVRMQVNEPFRVRSLRCGWEAGVVASDDATLRCTPDASFVLAFSRPLDDGSLEWLKRNLPRPLEFRRVQHDDYDRSSRDDVHRRPGDAIHLAFGRAQAKADLEMPAILAAENGATLGRPVELHLATGDYARAVHAHPGRLLAPPGADPPAIVQAINASEVGLVQDALGGASFEQARVVRHPRERNRAARIEPPAPPRDVQRNGGFVRGHAEPPLAAVYEVAYAAFDVTASRAGRQVLVWVTDWNGARPLAGVDVEVLEQREHALETLARGATGADGVAVLDLPRSDARSAWLVRATKEGRRSIMPLDGGEVDNPRDRRGVSTDMLFSPGEAATVLWGVTDRPLYRPGETVRYRLWTREREANRLVLPQAAEASLEWGPRYESAIATWSAKLDEFGSAEGELAIPREAYDGDYCFRAREHEWSHQAACFRVAGYRVNDMWTELAAERPFAREGETIRLDASVGYYSEGPAAGARVETMAVLTPLRIGDAYPDFAEYDFIDPFEGTRGYVGEAFRNAGPRFATADARGHASSLLTLSNELDGGAEKPIPFGRIEITASANGSGSLWAVSAPATVRFSRYRRYVGLKISPWLLTTGADATIETVVLSDEGVPQTDVDVRVVVERDDGPQSAHAGEPAFECRARAGAPCAFRAPRGGRYRLRAESDGAAPVEFERYAIANADGPDEHAPASGATLAAHVREQGGTSRAELALQQPFRRAKVLFAVEHGRVLHHWVQDVDAPSARAEIALRADWAPGVTVSAIVLDAGADAPGLRAARVAAASVDVPVTAAARRDALDVEVDLSVAKPRDEIAITLHNRSARRRQTTLALVDDAVRAMAPEYAQSANPANTDWLGMFGDWNVPQWFGLGTWARSLDGAFSQPGFGPLPGSGDEALETITVAGSNIRASDILPRGGPHDASLRLSPSSRADGRPASLRSRFVQTAAWDVGEPLEAGASRTVRLKLPDNLTRWRVLVWSNGADDDFELDEATVTSALPIELRADLPARLYAGDRSALAVAVRNHEEAPHRIEATLAANGAGVSERGSALLALAPNAESALLRHVDAPLPGTIGIVATAESRAARDGLESSVEVASRTGREHEAQAGWLDGDAVRLRLPPLPDGASDPTLRVRATLGAGALADGWIRHLRDYPHRCWEQTLSRAVGAALAPRLGATSWPDADTVVRDALAAAGLFQSSSGTFRYFVGSDGADVGPQSPLLTAYTLRAFGLLRELGYDVPEHVELRAREALTYLAANPRTNARASADEDAAVAAAVAPALERKALEALWDRRSTMSWFGRSELARALSAREDCGDLAAQALAELENAGERRGMQRVVLDASDRSAVMGSDLRDQCAVLDALAAVDRRASAAEAKKAFLRGLGDLYAGVTASFDTQASAQCLMAVRHAVPADAASETAQLRIAAGEERATIALDAAHPSAEWSRRGTAAELGLEFSHAPTTIASYVADVAYDVDRRASRPAAVGFSLRRRYAVLRDRQWRDVPAMAIRQGDWVRISLTLEVPRPRAFVAVSDVVPGGLRPADLALEGVTDVELRALAGGDSPWFAARRIDDRDARFYAEQLSPGTHEIRYFARAASAGTFFAPPATAELMYGGASSARTAPDTLTVTDPRGR